MAYGIVFVGYHWHKMCLEFFQFCVFPILSDLCPVMGEPDFFLYSLMAEIVKGRVDHYSSYLSEFFAICVLPISSALCLMSKPYFVIALY